MSLIEAPDLKRVTKLTLTDSVADSLRSAIFDRALQPGQRIPEAQMATRLGVSRAPVRDALAVLLQEGLVHRDQRGAVVTELTRSDVDEISQLRLALERLAVTLAIRGASEEQLAALAENIRRTARASAVGEAGELDLRFHELLVLRRQQSPSAGELAGAAWPDSVVAVADGPRRRQVSAAHRRGPSPRAQGDASTRRKAGRQTAGTPAGKHASPCGRPL